MPLVNMASSQLRVTGVRMFDVEDMPKHHVDKFQVPSGTSILRRGEVFHLAVTFKSSFNPEQHRVLLEFRTGRERRRLVTTSELIPVLEPGDQKKWPPGPTKWGAQRMRIKSERAVAVKVSSPSWLPIGRWSLEVRTELIKGRRAPTGVYHYPGHIYFLFNPWNPEDDTYLKDDNLLQEYVLNDIGCIWLKANTPNAIWNYGQFEDNVLPALEMALDQDGLLKRSRRGSPVDVSRAISRIVSASLVGKWSSDPEDFWDGKHPSEWTGSHEIVQQYLESGGQPVKYAQCWVYAGVAVTFCRAIGLPCRLITNLISGHDEDKSLIIDQYFDEMLEKDGKSSEFIWNFHAWVDVWMRRHDLPHSDYDGWQSIDGTPQERSEERYQCGPSPVKAVHSGDTSVQYDVPFVFAEVNGDRARWMRIRNRLRLIDVHENLIGQAVLTDDPEARGRCKVITAEYKSPEGSTRERIAIWRAASNPHLANASRRRRELDENRFLNDVNFEDDSPIEIEFGEDFDVAVVMKNKSGEVRTLDGIMIVELVDHRQMHQVLIKKSEPINITLRPHQSQTHRMFVGAQDYASRLRENTMMRLRTKCFVSETEQPWLSDDNQIIGVNVPNLRIEFNEDLWVEQPVLMFLSFDRTVKLALTDCRIRLGGSGLDRGGDVIELDDVPAGKKFFERIRIYPGRAGKQNITVKFTSRELPKVEGWVEVEVLEAGASRTPLNFDEHEDEILGEALRDGVID